MIGSSFTKEYLFDLFITGFENVSPDFNIKDVSSYGFDVGNLQIIHTSGEGFDIWANDINGQGRHLTRLKRYKNGKKYRTLLALYRSHENSKTKKKEASNLIILSRLMDEPFFLKRGWKDYSKFKPDAVCEIATIYTYDDDVTVYFVDKKTHAMFLLTKPSFDEWKNQ